MSEFSQSLQLGNSTLEALERQFTPPAPAAAAAAAPGQPRPLTRAACAVRKEGKPSQKQNSTEDVIEESPTSSKIEAAGQRSVRERLKTLSTQCRKPRRKRLPVEQSSSIIPGNDRSSSVTCKDDDLSALFLGSDEESVGNAGARLKRPHDDPALEGQSPEKLLSQHPNGTNLDDLFQCSTFSMDDRVRSQRSAADEPTGNYQSLFSQSDFTLEQQQDGSRSGAEQQTSFHRSRSSALATGNVDDGTELEVYSETLFDRALSSEKLHVSDLEQTLRVSPSSADVDFELNVEAVTFSQPLTANTTFARNDETSENVLQAWQDRDAHESFIAVEVANSRLELDKSLAAEAATSCNESVQFSESLNRSSVSLGQRAAPTEESVQEPAHTPPSMSLDQTKDLRLLGSWGLPDAVTKQYAKKGIVELFPWQVECLSRKQVLLESKNLVYSAPTSAGKTLVAEFLIAKTITERKRKALLIVPFVAVAREKTHYLQDLLGSGGGMRVDGFYGGCHPAGGFESVDLAVCTIEKANSIVNRLLEQPAGLGTLGLVVVDEVHLISDPSRGYILELLLTKVRFVARRSQLAIQIVCMSATLPNVELLARWLEADFYHTDYRPIALVELLKVGDRVEDPSSVVIRRLDGTLLGCPIPRDPDHVVLLCLETLLEGCSVIVFCPSKDWCEQLAITMASTMHGLKKEDHPHGELRAKLHLQLDGSRQEEVLLQLRNSPAGLDSVLAKTVRYGIAFHHAGLTTDERDIIEGSFRDGALRIVVATSTLSSGVNLPARRVIVRTPKFGGRPISSLAYRQMIGRAGRKGRDTAGESVLICTPAEERIGRELIAAELPPVRSCLDADNYTHLKRAVLEIVASGNAPSTQLLEEFVNMTLYSCERSYRFVVTDQLLLPLVATRRPTALVAEDEVTDRIVDPIASCVGFLLEYEFIRLQETPEASTVLTATRLGHACLASSLPPKEGFLLFGELQKARQCFVLESELHAVYLVTPYSVAYQWQSIGWMDFLDLWEKLPASARRVGELVGVRESFMVRAMRGTANLDYRALQIHKRFYTALALLELVNEVPLGTVAHRFKCCRGLLQSLQQSSSTFAGIVASFCASLNWTLLHLIVAQFRERLFFGVAHELLDLMRIPSLNGQRARTLYDAGITGLAQLANSERLTVEQILFNCTSFDTDRVRDGEHESEAARRRQLRNLFLTGRTGMTVPEATRLLIQEARTFLQLETGLENPCWAKQEEDEDEEQADKDASVRSLTPNQNQAEPRQNNDLLDGVSSDDIVLSRGDCSETANQFHNPLLMGHDHKPGPSGHAVPWPMIVDVCEDRSVYERFVATVTGGCDSISLSLAVAYNPDGGRQIARSGPKIGAHLDRRQPMQTDHETAAEPRRHTFELKDGLYVAGIAIATQPTTESQVYYVDLDTTVGIVSVDEKRQFVRDLLRNDRLVVALLDAKEQLKVAYRSGLLRFGDVGDRVEAGWDEVLCVMEDPRVASWLLQTDDKMLSLDAIIERHCPELKALPKGPKVHGGPADAKQRCARECLIVGKLMDPIRRSLAATGLSTCFASREMPVHVVLARAEVFGFPVDRQRLGETIDRLKACRERIAEDARLLNGNRRLNFGSSRAVAAALRLASGGAKRQRTVRQVLEQLDHPLAALVIAHRKIESNLVRTIEPLYRTIDPVTERVHGRSNGFTATGRITMYEPNLQTVVKDFDVPAPLGSAPVAKAEHFSCRGTFACRNPDRRVLLSADYCQLELCILTHLSQDARLMGALGSAKDVFRSLAARWNQLEHESAVSEQLRSRTKAIVYGVIYGMGVRAMAAELQADEDCARTLMEQFHATYPDIRRYTERIVRLTRQLGYIETLTGRRRYLPGINSTDPALRSEAERQAVCTTIQGSAADILKNAIVRMTRNLRRYRDVLDVGAIHLVLHLHDELIFEVPRAQLPKVAKILRSSMENCVKLSVPLRVKLKSGDSWGTMRELPHATIPLASRTGMRVDGIRDQ
ncbi:DNA polymerase theta [Anopheles cruzii]|uniref:DNA polymerase theta n=1 Tax=Anopheles cruzii TaxID=68878 RepID=UPI0022EC3EEC|nr:DNA polymerase theta [Anopheles cruzii]